MYKDFWVYPAVLFSEGVFHFGWTFICTWVFKKALLCHSLEIVRNRYSMCLKWPVLIHQCIQPVNSCSVLAAQEVYPTIHPCSTKPFCIQKCWLTYVSHVLKWVFIRWFRHRVSFLGIYVTTVPSCICFRSGRFCNLLTQDEYASFRSRSYGFKYFEVVSSCF